MAKTTSARNTSRRSRRGGRADVIELFTAPAQQSWVMAVVGLIIRLRAELFALVVGLVAWLWLRDVTGSGVAAWSIIGGTVVLVLVVPPSRRFTLGRLWCVADRHRLRKCLRQTKIRTMNMDGALPFLIWARPTKTGEKVWFGLRAGGSADDIESALRAIAPACYARDARLSRGRRIATIVTVEIVRRDPLSKPKPIASPLARLTSRLTGQPTVAEGCEPIAAATVADIATIPTQRADSAHSGGKTGAGTGRASGAKGSARTIKPAPAPASEAPAVVVNGEDLSDYID